MAQQIIGVYKREITARKKAKEIKRLGKKKAGSRIRIAANMRLLSRMRKVDAEYREEILQLDKVIESLKKPAVREQLRAGGLPREWETPPFKEFFM